MNTNAPTPTVEQLKWMYKNMVLSRRLEDRIEAAYLEGKVPVFSMAAGPIPGEMHLSKGQEPCAVGVCVHLSREDWVSSSHRSHHVAVAKGVDLKAMTAEIYGKETGLGAGKGGHMHLVDEPNGFSCSGIVGQGIGLAVGHALAAKMRGDGTIAVAFTGEGAANQGLFHEAMNLAALWKLPFICVIEDNNWGVSVSKARSTAIARNSDRASAYGVIGEYVEGNDIWETFAAADRAVNRARAGEGPTIIEIETARLSGHFLPDPETYVPLAERESRQDPITVMRERLIAERLLSAADLDAIDIAADGEADEAAKFAAASPLPAGQEAYENVFVKG